MSDSIEGPDVIKLIPLSTHQGKLVLSGRGRVVAWTRAPMSNTIEDPHSAVSSFIPWVPLMVNADKGHVLLGTQLALTANLELSEAVARIGDTHAHHTVEHRYPLE
ncbi:hypothetical protein NDU88_007034 [Pleurodeles waltl]|uniref:Uncharacterized protein n=1 Tax=Pleurodeles waltl TaxID=8319 RepID=A0AAV7WFW9_PLEWA|nr:hypothetical protein NDU88_007034 [Pleurodeles waltl]